MGRLVAQADTVPARPSGRGAPSAVEGSDFYIGVDLVATFRGVLGVAKALGARQTATLRWPATRPDPRLRPTAPNREPPVWFLLVSRA